MQEYVIDVSKLEELQTLKDTSQLEGIFFRARSTIINGEKVVLVRKHKTGPTEKFDELSTEEELEQFKARVFLYLE